jgi:hypothetical protein
MNKRKNTSKPARKGESPKPATPAKLSPVQWKHAAFQALWTTYLHLRSWGLPEYEELTPTDKEYFRGLLAKGRQALFSHIEECKRAVLRGGLDDQVRDEWLGLIGLSDFDLAKGFPQAKRHLLGKILDEMWPLMVRLDPEALPAGTGPIPNDLITTEVAISEYKTSRVTIRRKVKAGKLRDYRPPNSPANTKLLLSRAELGRLFARKK